MCYICMSIQLLSSRWWREIEALVHVMYKLEFYHLTSDGALTPCFIDSSHRSRDYCAAFNLIAVCAAYCKVRIVAFAIEDTHLHILMEGSYEDCMVFKIMFERSYIRHVTKTRGTLEGANIDLDIQPIEDENHLLDIGTYVVAQPTKDGKKVLPYDYRWGTGSMYFRSNNHISIWRYDEDGVLHDPVPAGSLSYSVVRKLACSKRRIPKHWLICNGLILPENYVDVALYERIYRTHNSFRVFMSSNKQKDQEIKRREAAYLGVTLDDTEATQKCKEVCASMFGVTTVRKLNGEQRVQLAQRLRTLYKLSFRQLAKLTHLPMAEIRKYVA